MVGLALYYVAVVDRGAFNVRYSSFVTPALYVLAGAGLTGWASLWRPLGAVAVAAALALWPWAIHADLYDPRFAREDISGVTAWLRDHAEAGDLILVDQKYPFGFYYQRYAIDPAVTPTGPEPAPARYLFVDINTIDQRLDQWAGEAKHVYWVQWFESDTDPRRAVAFLAGQGRCAQRRRIVPGLFHRLVDADPADDLCPGTGTGPAGGDVSTSSAHARTVVAA